MLSSSRGWEYPEAMFMFIVCPGYHGTSPKGAFVVQRLNAVGG